MPSISRHLQLAHPKQRPIRIGLLLCGNVHAALQPVFGSYEHCLINKLQLHGRHVEIKVWRAWQNELPYSVAEADAYVVSGSPASVLDREYWIDLLGAFIRRAHSANRRLLGICFGHQMIHHALGGKVARASTGWGLGVYSIQLYHKITSLASCESIALFAMHRDQVIVPAEGFDHLGGNAFCPYYLLSHTDNILTIQGHPEFTRHFFDAFLTVTATQFDANTVTNARLSMQKNDDSDVICGVINRFLLGRLLPTREICAQPSKC
ncbi:MAG: type 1 glutamine amidotransferase [Pseudomonas sp.]|nr:type 1 glutamine amidotransferase [Pseudomonas sp.]